MSWTPQLNVVCGRCGKPRGLRHVCFSNSQRKATAKPKVSFGKCGACGKPYGGNPLAHVCAPKSDFKRRKSRAAKAERAAERKKRQAGKHDYQACADKDCPKPLCVAFKTGRRLGYQEGFGDGFGAGFDAGLASCPGPHGG
ncbi:MAG TPA: hypothetical protein VMK84_36460 [Streptosporangiaceae bacterium]|nr:hypothetical protein [Streptosporangiaceae bacterium]